MNVSGWVPAIKVKLHALSEHLKKHLKLHTVVAIFVFVAGLAATIYYWHNLKQSVRQDLEVAYTRQVRSLGTIAGARVELYDQLLRGSAGLFTIHTTTTQADWDKYHQPYDIRQRYPDVQSIGVARYLHKDEVSGYLQRRAAQGDTAFTIFPAGDRDLYVPVTFDAVYAGASGIMRGYDAYTDPVRKQAMDRALKTGKPAMTGVVQTSDGQYNNRPAFLLYMPLYRNGQSVNTEQQRKAAIVGFAYISVDMQVFLDEVVKDSQSPYVAVQIRDTQSGRLAYQSTNYASIANQGSAKVSTSSVKLYGQSWRITIAASPHILSARERQLPDQALWRGLLTCIFFAGLVWYLITDRERQYARQKQQEVQTAKDDLLSLASHQLRTPATVVKQYVGMLLQGYGGTVTKQQADMLTNAYESNERQLEIINQLLYVARLDAGRITLHTQKVDIVKLVRGVARDQAEDIRTNKHKLTYDIPHKTLSARIDPHYIRMVLENLLSNAIKYTPEGGTIVLGADRDRGMVRLTVRDNGVGIPLSAQQTIFDKFSRVENELSTDVNGSGVGLYLTQQIVALHGGTIEVESAPDKGSTFIVRLPLGLKRADSATLNAQK